jgi:formate dehydrogenase major subunit
MNTVIITINGKEYSVDPEMTILEAIRQHNVDDIPTLCHDKRLEHFTSCFLCMVEVEGINKLIPSCSTKVNAGMKIRTRSENIIESRRTALALLMSNHYADCVGPCSNNCPAGVDAQTYIALISMGKYREALKVVKENNPLPLSIGRVCVRDCEAACRRKFVDDPVSVNALKRFVADYDSVSQWTPEVKPRNGRKVAVIGAGPSGLSCAYYLCLEGYEVTILEKLPKPGGMLRYGIPEYRLPKKILDAEINWILNLGIELKTGVEIGVDYSIQSLFDEGYESVFLGVGAQKASKMNLAGEDITYGVFRGIDFLREIDLSFIPKLKGTVVIVGGGNTAIDAARTALRCGAGKVKIVYRRSIKEMPANAEEIEAAQKEGVEILFLTNPKSLISENHKLKGIECLKMGLVEGKPGERAKPVPIAGSEFIIDCDFLIGAIGQAVDERFLKLDNQLTLRKEGTVSVNKETMETSIPGLFAGGDVVTGPFTAITSVAQGKKAAQAIMSFLTKGKAEAGKKKFYSFKTNLSKLNQREFESFRKIAREKMEELAVTDRVHSFREVDRGLSEDQVQLEVKRCLECGCSEFYDCSLRKYCDEYDVNIKEFIGETKKFLADGRHPFILLDPNKCINCGRCVRTCSEILKVSALGFVNRGFKSVVKPAMEKALSETNCISCGNCIDACPTGAISEKYPFKILGTLPKENIETICNFCSLGCRINIKKVSDDVFYVSSSTEKIKDSDNKGFLCSKGRFGYRYLLDKKRLVFPQIRKNGIINYTDLDSAIKYSEKQINSLIEKYGNDSVAVLASPRLSNEELYLLQKFVRTGLKNNNISSFTHLTNKPDDSSIDDMTGFTSSTVSLDDLNSADIIVVMGSGFTEENVVLELKIKEAQKRGAKVILINSSETRLTKYADLWIDSRKGTNTYLIDSMNKTLIDKGLIDDTFISSRSGNFIELIASLVNIDPTKAVTFSGIDRNIFDNFVTYLSNRNSNIIFIYDIDSRGEKSVNDIKAVSNFLMLTGRIGKEKNGMIILREFNNSTGLMDMGVTPDYLPGFVRYNDVKDILRIGNIWNSALAEIFKPVNLASRLKNGAIKGLLVFGEDPLNVKEFLKYFNGVEFLLVSDAYHTGTTDEADVILPAATYYEQSGTYTRCDNKIQQSNKVINGITEYENWELISRLASRFAGGFNFETSEEIFDEIKYVSRFYNFSGIDKSWMHEYFNDGFTGKRLFFSTHSIDFSTFDNVKYNIHYQDNYYFSSVRNKIVP